MEGRCSEDGNGIEKLPVGTIFFVKMSELGINFEYGVTCNHVVSPEKDGTRPLLFVRVNRATGAFEDIPTGHADWISDPQADVALLPISLAPTDYRRWSYQIADEIKWATIKPVPGDQVFLAGLFVGYPGESSVEALIRTGTVAREAATVEIQSDLSSDERYRLDVHLIESRSWGGESGSPVFAYRETFKVGNRSGGFWQHQNQPPNVESQSRPELIGMLHGHFPVEFGGTSTNSGIGIVIPIKSIYDVLLNNDWLQTQRREAISQQKSG